MDSPAGTTLRIGSWDVKPAAGSLSRHGATLQIDARSMKLLVYLAEHAGEVVSMEDLLSQVWAGVIVTQNSVYQAVTSLRRHLEDDPKHPAYIVTVPRLGYRLVAPVSHGSDLPLTQASTVSPAHTLAATSAVPKSERTRFSLWALGVGICLVFTVVLLYFRSPAGTHAAAAVAVPRKSVAVLPFLDLTTQEMNEEYFADGMTEELIDKLSQVPQLQVPSPTASFYFKGKQLTVAEMAKSLGVSYVLDGSIRKSVTTLRIDARLVRGVDGYVVWSETYDRPAADQLMVQEDIANEVVKALRAAVN